MTAIDREGWATVLAQLDEPPLGTVAEALADARDLDINDAYDVVEEALGDGDLVTEDTGAAFDTVRVPDDEDDTPETPKTDDMAGGGGGSLPSDPMGDGGETGEEDAVEREDAVAALRDVLRFYNSRLDDVIGDHTDEGEHPERPTTARDYFTEVRGWDDDTVDSLLLGWAPADHVDELVAYLFDRGHSREAMIATGALGEKDSGGLYATFSARYVLPYFDADGEPAYAIARCTGGDGGGAKGYGGHPDDWKAGKYAKLRHTDDRVPFEEPIYGLDTLDESEHVVVAEGIADAITAREEGYAVLSPVAKEFKEAHYAPFAEALDDHHVERVTIVADADSIRNASEDEIKPESIGDAVGLSLSPTGAGLAGALRTATKLGDRADVDVRVTIPPAPADTESDLDEFVTGDWAGDLAALLRSAKPAEAFDELDAVVSDEPAAEYDEFDPEEYEPTATSADETTDDIRDVYAALDRLDAQRVADRTIVSEWLEGRSKHRTFAPTWAPADYTGTANYVDAGKWVDTGGRGGYGGPAVMAAIDAGLVRDTECPDAVEGETWMKAVDHLRDLGFSIPELEDTRADDEDDRNDEHSETPRDLLGLDVVVEPAVALKAASAVKPGDLTTDLPELERDDVDDVAVAVALAEDMIPSADVFPDDGRYTEAYYRARDVYGAPLPKYLDNSTLEERTDLVYAALDRVKPKHILDSCRSDVTVADPSGKAVAKLDPTWEDSESGERIVAGYGRGFYCVEHGRSFAPIQLVALEHGLIDTEAAYPRGEAFKRAYQLLRTEYHAPVPKWRASILEHVAVLPPATRVLGDDSVSRSLDDVRADTESLLRDAFSVRDRAQLITAVPNTGKTFGTAIVSDDQPVLYLAQRNQLKEQMEAYAQEVAADEDIDAEPSARHLPILAENQLDEAVITEAVGAVREDGRGLLKNRDTLASRVEKHHSDEEGEEEDDVDLDRPTCPTAEGEHGESWAVAVQTARALGAKPADIHTHAKALFGEEMPCQDEAECPYNLGWDAVRNPDDSADILIGSPGHPFIGSAATYFDRDGAGERVERERAIVFDEFPGGNYLNDYGERSLDHATWLANSLVGIDTREDLVAADLDDDVWVDQWLDGEGEEITAVGETIEILQAGRALIDARDEAAEALDTGVVDTSLSTDADIEAARDALQRLCEQDAVELDLDAVAATLHTVESNVVDDADQAYATDHGDAGPLYDLASTLENVASEVAAAASSAGDAPLGQLLRDKVSDLPVGGDLRGLLRDAGNALDGDDIPEALIEAAITALRGGRDGCSELAIYADDGYAHPDAWALLAGAIADGVEEVDSETFSFDDRGEGSRFKRFRRNDATILADKNHHGTIVADYPSFTDITGAKCPVVGLDATGRRELWKIAIGRDTQRRDIHDTDAERRDFLRDVMNLRVVQTTDHTLPYHGDPTSTNFNEDLELVRTVADEYTGDAAGAVDDDDPAVISTKKVLDHLQDDLADISTDRINYENMKGSDELGDRQAAVVLGSQHYGDASPEMWGLLAGDDVGRGDTHGNTLDYGSDVANAYLRYMREDHTMQAILRAGRNDDDSVVFAHTSALRDDLPVDDEGAVLSAHSKGTLAVVEAAREFTGAAFTAQDIAEEIAEDSVGLRQVQNVLADLRDSGYLRVEKEGGPGVNYEYDLEEEPGLADVELPSAEPGADGPETYEKSPNGVYNTWNFVSRDDPSGETGVVPPSTPTIPAGEASGDVNDAATAGNTGPPRS